MRGSLKVRILDGFEQIVKTEQHDIIIIIYEWYHWNYIIINDTIVLCFILKQSYHSFNKGFKKGL